jgi:threonine dehydratase
VLSGANTNFDRLRYISERTEIGEQREAVISVTSPEKPGAFRAFCSALGRRNITEFNYRYSSERRGARICRPDRGAGRR